MLILDCTLRDGGYINNWQFSDVFLMKYMQTITQLPIKFIEIGFVNNIGKYANKDVGEVRYLTKKKIEWFSSVKSDDQELVVMGDYGNVNIDLLKERLPIGMVRIAFHKHDMQQALLLCKEIKQMGYAVSANAMAVTNYDEDELKELFQKVNEYELDYLYIADSYGSLSNKELHNLVVKFSSQLTTSKIGIHLHNNMNNAYSNYEMVKDMNLPVEIADTTLFGMGRGAGNLQTELAMIQMGISSKPIIQLLSFIFECIKPLFSDKESNWSYELDYLLSGLLKIHPNYVVKMREMNVPMLKRFEILQKISEGKNKGRLFNMDDLIGLLN